MPAPPTNYQVAPPPVSSGGAQVYPSSQTAALAAARLRLNHDAELQLLNRRLAVAKEEFAEYRLTWPVVLTAVGGGMLLIGASTLATIGNDYGLDTLTSGEIAGFVVVGSIGVVSLAIGVVWLLNRLSARAPARERVEGLERQVRERERELLRPGTPSYR
ncbi:MAG: hypothetical protein AAGF12_13075 [Myxococcota bacterium]